ncbi:MAG: peptide chain release factor N(5)-glutamine methyltransferase [Defluviitaleaceae bacterium]|nr:peptide chain release factor N(5)-glutamine methyltransferase [Defluviitaleaceae bacterium]
MNINEALSMGTKAIGKHEARLLLSHITGLSPAEIIISTNKPLDEKAIGAFLTSVKRREAKEPLQYIMGTWEFMGLEFITDSRALIPRPETELLVEEAIAYIHKLCRPAKILDVCTGSGCIAVAIAKLTDAEVTAIDISPDALALAAQNAALHQLQDRIKFVQSDLLHGFESQVFDIIVSNPPYIPTGEIGSLQPELCHEPILALDGGPDGLDLYRQLIPQSMKYLSPGGVLLLEIGPQAVETIMFEAGYGMIRTIKDYAGLPRIVIGVQHNL